MKKILLVLAAGMVIMSCNDTDKKADANTTSGSNATLSQDSLDKLNAMSKAANNPAPSSSNTPADSSQTTIEWLEGTNKDFGTMKKGETLEVTFKFKNTGTKPLIISNVTAGCGCTIPEVPKKPYAPGETGVIKASFDSNKGIVGMNSKQVNVFANTNPVMITLAFSVTVKEKS
jgi:hypothetical protein